MDFKRSLSNSEIISKINDIKITNVISEDTNTNVVKRTAKKSTATQDIKPSPAVTRRQAAVVNNKRNSFTNDKFLENFDPESSVRERRKLTRKVNSVTTVVRKIPGALYDEKGVHISSGIDLCDCLNKACSGCHYPCPKCGSAKCGPECRVHRKFIYDQIEYNGCDLNIKNPLAK